MKISRRAAAFLAVVLVVNGIHFTENISYANEKNIAEKVVVMDEQQESMEGISTLQYLQADGKWNSVKEKDYYGKSVQLRFVIDTEVMDVQSVEADIFLDGKKNSVIDFSKDIPGVRVLNNGQKREYYFQLDQDALNSFHTLNVEVHIQKLINSEEGTETEEKIRNVRIDFPEIYLETRIPELEVTDNNMENVWTSEDVIVNLKNVQKNQKVHTIFYVKKSEEASYTKIPDSDIKKVRDEKGENSYVYHIKESGKETYYFKAAYDLADSNETYLSDEQKVNVQIDKILPIIKVEQSRGDWTKEDVKFTLSNLADNVSDITYYVRHNDSAWEKIDSNRYVVSLDEKGGLYQFKAVSAVQEEDKLYQSAEIKSWISNERRVYIDKQKPAENKINITRKSGDMGTDDWYGRNPWITLSVTQDEGSRVFGFYRLYQVGEERNYKLYEDGESIYIPGDGKYILETYAEDEASNASRVIQQKINVDTTKPEITNIQFTDLDGEQLEAKDIIGYPYLTNKKVLVTIEAADSLSGVEKIVYKSIGSSQIKEKTKQGNKVQFTISPKFIGKISAYAVDKMGNKSDVMVSDGLIEEITKPVITVESNVDLSKWQNKDFVCDINVEDADSGIEKIIYEVNETVIKETDYSDEKTLKKDNKQSITFTEESKNGNGDTLKITAIDRAGNTRIVKKKVYLDKTEPKVTVNGIENNGTFNKEQDLTVSIEENIYEYADIDIQVERYVDGNKTVYPTQEMIMNGNTASKTLHFEQDGTYTVTVQATDKAGNRSNTITREFIIDQTAPVIELSGVNRTYYGTNVLLNVSVQESNFENNKVSIQVTREYNGKITKNSINNWKSTGKNTLSQEEFTLDGDYIVKVSAVDQAGNGAKEKTVKFTIDQTAPKIIINGIEPYEVTNKKIILKSFITENNIKQNGTKLEITKEDIKGNIEIILSDYLNVLEKESRYETSIEEEGKYTLVLSSTDKAENTTKKELHFIIDKTAPVIMDLDDYDGKYLQSFTWNQDKNEIIEDLTAVESHIFMNGIEYDGSFSAEQDGKYVLEITAEDEMHQKSKKSAEFILDSTAPVIHAVMKSEDSENITLKAKNTVYQTGKVEIGLSDKEDWISRLTVNGQEIELKEKINQYQIPIDEKGNYDIQVEALDLAGNISRFTTKLECTSKTDEVLKIVVIAGGIVALAIIAGVLYRNKKRKTVPESI